MYVDFARLYALLKEDAILSYKLMSRLFCEPLSPRARLWAGERAVMLLDYGLHLFGEEGELDRFLADLEPGEYSLFAVPVKYLPVLEKHFAEIHREEDTTAYTLAPGQFSGPEAEELDSLTVADAEFVDAHWTYRHEGSLEFFRRILAELPSSAVRIDGRLAGWAVCYDRVDDMVNLGSLRVLEPYRRRGLGRKLALDLVKKVLARGWTPLIHIVDSNTASKNLSMGIGFKPYPEKIFWGRGIKK